VGSSVPSGWQLPPDARGGRFAVDVPEGLCAARELLFGGWAMALAVDAAEAHAGLPTRDITMQFLAPVRAGDRLDVRTEVVRRGRTVTHLALLASREGTDVFRAQVVAAAAAAAEGRDWAPMPDVPPAHRCPSRTYRFDTPGSARETLDVRVVPPEPAPGDGAPGRVLLWARVLPSTGPNAMLAVLSDHVPYLIVRSLPAVRSATTVLASLRVTGLPRGEWTLLDVALVATDGAFCTGAVRAWSADGRLVAHAEQLAHTRFDQEPWQET
jgi:acyl-CoA thioesterase